MTSRRALLSVYNKDGIADFAARLHALGFEIVSTGGTFRAIQSAGVPATYVSEATGSPEVFGGRVKTLHPTVHGGILYRRDLDEHQREAEAHGVVPIDVVAVNLYPFQDTVAREGVTEPEAVEQIDIGGPTMVRAAAKNFRDVTVVVSPDDYNAVADALAGEGLDLDARRNLALKAFRHTASYDAAIATWLGQQAGEGLLPAERHEAFCKVNDLRYGENPHQAAALYHAAGAPPLAGAEVLQGKALSYNNLVDLDGAVEAVLEFDDPTCVIVKHTNPCGTGRDATSVRTAYERALAGDPVSAFGGIVALNREVDEGLAALIATRFYEIIAAPGFTDAASEVFAAKKNLRLVVLPPGLGGGVRPRHTLFGTLVQECDPRIDCLAESWTVVTERAPTPEEETALRFLWRVCKHVKSNAIVTGDHERTYGVGAGQMSRVDAVRLAVGGGDCAGASLASDAFFPFRDGVDVAAAAGIRAVVQPGGSKRDAEVIAACNEHGIAMVVTGHRHFKH